MDLRKRLRKAVKYYWQTRDKQRKFQGSLSGTKDHGNRSAVTGGAQADGFIKLFREILRECGLPDVSIHTKSTTLPGYFRPLTFPLSMCSKKHHMREGTAYSAND
jgi:hypothetical protein